MSRSFDSKKKTIDGIEYEVHMFPAGKGFENLFRLKNFLGGSVGSMLGDNMDKAVANLGGNLSAGETLAFVQDLLSLTYVVSRTEGPVGEAQIFDTHFAGRYGHLFKVLKFTLEVNYQDFFVELKDSFLQLLKTLAPKPKAVPVAAEANPQSA